MSMPIAWQVRIIEFWCVIKKIGVNKFVYVKLQLVSYIVVPSLVNGAK